MSREDEYWLERGRAKCLPRMWIADSARIAGARKKHLAQDIVAVVKACRKTATGSGVHITRFIAIRTPGNGKKTRRVYALGP